MPILAYILLYNLLTFCICKDTNRIASYWLEIKPRTLIVYQTRFGKRPFEDWYNHLKDLNARAIILRRFNRIILGNLGDCKSLGGNIFELRVDFGPGYRLYFGKLQNSFVILLFGGSKSTQSKDIQQARIYWADFLSMERGL